MIKLLLVNPNFNGVVLAPSLGLGFIGSYVQGYCDVEIVEPAIQGLTMQQTLDKAADADIIGLVCYTESRFQCFDFARKVRDRNPDCVIVVGGPHVDTLDVKILEHYSYVDIVVRGEGEESMLDIVNGAHLECIPGITWRGEGIIRNPDRVPAATIEEFNYDYSLCYYHVAGWIDAEVPKRFCSHGALPIIASRGCPFQCAFCAAHWHWGGTYRCMLPARLALKLQRLSYIFEAKYFRFYDALFFGDEAKIMEFCDLLEEMRLNISFRVDVRVGTKPSVLWRLKSVGCDVVGFGIESGDNAILKNINKKTTRAQAEETIRICKKLGMWTIGFFMVALPGEDMPNIEKSFSLFRSLDVVNVQFFKIHPNTIVYNDLLQRGEINDDVWFDPRYGFQTEYGNEVYYCRELFPSAHFSFKDVRVLTDYSSCRYNVTHLRTVLSRGLVTGGVTLALSFILALILRSSAGRGVYRKCFCGLSDRVCKILRNRRRSNG